MTEEQFSTIPPVAIKVANATLFLGITFSLFIIAMSLDKVFQLQSELDDPPVFFYITALAAFIVLCFFSVSLTLAAQYRVSISMVILSIAIPVFSFETYHQLTTETKYEFLQSLRKTDVAATVNPEPFRFIPTEGLSYGDGTIFPLGGLANRTTFLANENGYFPIIRTDRYGFTNQDVTYQPDEVDILLLGDSLTEGVAVYASANIGALLRLTGLNAISLGKEGNGPLLEFASLREYGKPIRPKVVIWLFYVNDIMNLENEMESSLLMSYFNDPNFSQDLIQRQDQIDRALEKFILTREQEYASAYKAKRFQNILQLDHTRKLISLTYERPPTTTALPQEITKNIFRNILKKADTLVSSWGGELYFLYLPSFFYNSDEVEILLHDLVIDLVAGLDIPIIDIHDEVFLSHPDALSLFPYRKPMHYNQTGYRAVSATITKRIKTDNIAN